jgi:hypothetical protein
MAKQWYIEWNNEEYEPALRLSNWIDILWMDWNKGDYMDISWIDLRIRFEDNVPFVINHITMSLYNSLWFDIYKVKESLDKFDNDMIKQELMEELMEELREEEKWMDLTIYKLRELRDLWMNFNSIKKWINVIRYNWGYILKEDIINKFKTKYNIND